MWKKVAPDKNSRLYTGQPMKELLNLYRDEPYGDSTVLLLWNELLEDHSHEASQMFGELIQFILRIHMEIAPEEVWSIEKRR